jgi:hypothetical protein
MVVVKRSLTQVEVAGSRESPQLGQHPHSPLYSRALIANKLPVLLPSCKIGMLPLNMTPLLLL